MEIVLIRHGKPVSANNPRVTAAGYASWVRDYNHSSVSESSRPCTTLQHKFREHYIVSSDLRRAMESAYIWQGREPMETHAEFREMDIPRYRLPLKLKAWTWLYLSRAFWTLGATGPFESFTEARVRAKKASRRLVQLAETHERVVLFGHGYMNLYVRKELLSLGWKVTEKSNKYWGVSCLKT